MHLFIVLNTLFIIIFIFCHFQVIVFLRYHSTTKCSIKWSTLMRLIIPIPPKTTRADPKQTLLSIQSSLGGDNSVQGSQWSCDWCLQLHSPRGYASNNDIWNKVKGWEEYEDQSKLCEGYQGCHHVGIQGATWMDTQVADRKKGSMDETLFIETGLFYKTLDPNLAPNSVGMATSWLKGPFGSRWIADLAATCTSECAIKFGLDMHCEGVHMGTGLPNATLCQQDIDDWFQLFKGMSDTQAQEVIEEKLYNYFLAVKNQQEGSETEIKSACLTNDDLPTINNGKPDDPPKKRSLYHCTTPDKIFCSWMKVGFVPLTSNALKHKKVWKMLGDGGASDEMTKLFKDTELRYKVLKEWVSFFSNWILLCCYTDTIILNYYYYKQPRLEGINSFVFNEELPWYTKSMLHQKSDDNQVKSLVEQKQAFSVGALWVALGPRLMGSKTTIKAQVAQIKKGKKSAAEMTTKKANDSHFKVKNAEASFELFKLGGKM